MRQVLRRGDFRENLSEAASAGERGPGENANEAFFVPILFEHLGYQFFVDLMWRIREYESKLCYCPIVPVER